MDERIEKAFAVANYMATLSNQRRLILEELQQKLLYYQNGGTFKVSPELINFVKTAMDLGHVQDVPFLDANGWPIMINDVAKFFEDIVSVYFEAVNDYSAKFTDIKSKRKVQDLVSL
jgi:hypothetical protein